jgi:putative nucleotidyltransferase with HDIG domain
MPDPLAKPARPWALRLLPPFPAVANRVLALAKSDDISTRDIADIIQLDPTFMAEILRVANSALFGVSREITSAERAVALLGLDRVKAMATLIALNTMLKSAVKIESLRTFWVHSVVTAMLCGEAARVSRVDADSAYTAGLLHNLGTLGIMAAYPEEYARMLDVSAECHLDLLKTERDLFEIDHCAAGAYLAQDWNFPDEIAAAIATHHDDPVDDDKLCRTVQVCWRLADVFGYLTFPDSRAWTYEELLALIPGGEDSWFGNGVEAAQRTVRDRLATFRL